MSAFTWPPESLAGAVDGAGEADHVQSAVLVPLFLAGVPAEPHVVLTRRRADLRRHAGEISFPGGRRDAADADLSVTALREAEEEIGLAREQVRLLGHLPPTSTFATKYVIHPFVGAVPAGVAWQLSAREVDAVLELPLAAVRSGRTRTRLERRGVTFEIDAFAVDEHVIWGATARILEDLFEHLSREDGDLGELSLPTAAAQPDARVPGEPAIKRPASSPRAPSRRPRPVPRRPPAS